MSQKEFLLQHTKRAQSLLELTLVLSVIAIILMVIFSYSRGVIKQSSYAAQRKSLKTVANYCQLFYIQNGYWPNDAMLLKDYIANENFLSKIQLTRHGEYLVIDDGNFTEYSYPSPAIYSRLAYEQ